MNTFTLTILNIEITFNTKISTKDLEKIKRILEARAKQVESQGKLLNKEKILLLISLGLAHDLLQAKIELDSIPNKIESLLSKCERDSILL